MIKTTTDSKGVTIDAPTIFVIFGVTGDLSKRKLLPAIFDLYAKGFLPKAFRIVGFSRGQKTDLDFREFIKDVIGRKQHGHKEEKIEAFLKNAHYVCGRFEEPNHYEDLAKKLIELDDKLGQCTNKLFYLAVPPTFYDGIFQNLADSGLSIPCSNETGWTRVLVEKPFGKDLETAQKLDKTLGLLFKEKQIFRIDHYLAKETLQNILSFRFSNKLFEPIWNNKHIEKVEIKLWEVLGMEGRGAFYEDAGALRDVGQNHMLQMLAFIAMENPVELAAGPIRKERAKALEALKQIKVSDISKRTLRAQYQGYREEKNVGQSSKTETFFRLEAYVNNKRWRGVPFYLESGKRLKETKTEISIYFKESTACLCPPEATQHHQNILTFRIQPDEGISILFWAKKPGFETELEIKLLSFLYKDSPNASKLPDAYERILFDCIRGDQILFTSTDEVTASWKFITPILKNWKKTKLYEYKQGSEGPKL